MDSDTIQTIIQGGAVGLALVVLLGVYLIIRRSMEIVREFVFNHMVHLTESIDKNSEVLEKLDETITSLNRRV